MARAKRPRVVIVGAGFGGLWAARTLAGSNVDVLVIDRNNYHTFLPLLYQVAAAELEPEQIGHPVRSILRRMRNVDFLMAEVTRVDFAARVIATDGPIIHYDYLIVATGSISHYFGIPGAIENAFPLKTLEQGVTLRNHILCTFEKAAHEMDVEQRKRLLTFVVVGGGPTGLEFTGALAELIHGPLTRDYPTLDFNEVRVVLLEAGDSLLAGMAERLQSYSLSRLQYMDVEVMLRQAVARVEPETVHLKDGTVIPCETVIWTAGVQGDPEVAMWGLPVGRSGRVLVEPTLQVPDHPEVYVVGDLAYFEEDGRPLPMIAPVAVQQGTWAANNILCEMAGQAQIPFRYRDKGAMATIGRNSAVVRFGRSNFTGFIAWVLWLTVHLFYLIGFRNRLLVLINWSWDYFLFERAVRLIFPSDAGVRCASIHEPDVE